MEAKKLEKAIVEVTASWDYAAVKKFNRFWVDRTNYHRFCIIGILMLALAASFSVLAVFLEAWPMFILPLGCIGFSVVCFVKYRRLKSDAIQIERPKLRDPSFGIPPALIGVFIGLMMWRSSNSEYYVYIGPTLALLGLLIIILAIYNAKKNFKAIDYTCTFYESYLFFFYTALGMLAQKGIPYTVCLAQETSDTFYVQFPAERNGQRNANPYYDCIILEKQKLTPEQAETLRELFTRKFGDKFNQYYQK